jgi:hypothetical protein
MSKNDHPLYWIWLSMVRRCHLDKDTKIAARAKTYAYYGGRGITVYVPWQASFETFAADIEAGLGHRALGMTLDRIDGSLGYQPGNLRWASRKEQIENSCCRRMLTANGVTKSMTDWARDLGIDRTTITHRLRRGWTEEEAVRP